LALELADAGSGGGVEAERGRGTEGVGRGGCAGVFIFETGALATGLGGFDAAAAGRGGAAEARAGFGAVTMTSSTIVRSSVAAENGSGLRAITRVGASSSELLSSRPTLSPSAHHFSTACA
jgi:hypothetical protein